jgi:hypothetical protein
MEYRRTITSVVGRGVNSLSACFTSFFGGEVQVGGRFVQDQDSLAGPPGCARSAAAADLPLRGPRRRAAIGPTETVVGLTEQRGSSSASIRAPDRPSKWRIFRLPGSRIWAHHSASPDGRRILLTIGESRGSDLMLLDGISVIWESNTYSEQAASRWRVGFSMTAGFQSGWIATEIHNIEEMVGSIPAWSIVPALCTSRRQSVRSLSGAPGGRASCADPVLPKHR